MIRPSSSLLLVLIQGWPGVVPGGVSVLGDTAEDGRCQKTLNMERRFIVESCADCVAFDLS